MARRGYSTGYRLVTAAKKLGLLDRVVRYQLEGGIPIDVPLVRHAGEHLWDEVDVREYAAAIVGYLTARARALPAPVTLVDCGAGIGVLSALMASRCPHVDRVVAVESGSAPFDYLRRNLARIRLPIQCVRATVSDRVGMSGRTPVVRLDDLGIAKDGGSLILRIGEDCDELAVLRGARETLKRARAFVVVFQASARHARRTGVDPMQAVRLISRFRRARARVCDVPGEWLDPKRPFFEQVRRRRHHHIAIEPTRVR